MNTTRNILARGLDTLRPDLKRTQESDCFGSIDVDGVNMREIISNIYGR